MNPGTQDRAYWIDVMCRIVHPVLAALSERRLKQSMPATGKLEEKERYNGLQALGRCLAGIAPWLETGPSSGEEGRLREEYARMARAAIDAGTDPESPDFLNFEYGFNPIVETAFFSHAILRAPTELWDKLDERVRRNVIRAFKQTRNRRPHFNNWLLFSAIIEVALCKMGESDWDPMRVDFALKQHEQWYVGDGMYKDGPEFHWDYYNSFVIHPMLIDIVEHMRDKYDWGALREPILARARRYATIQERHISPEGTFPAIGRSLTYRFGAFQLLSQISLREELEESIAPAQVRSALTAVIRRIIEMPGTFDDEGWLQVGFCGFQPDIGEKYCSNGQLYLCTAVFLPLGLPADNPFWQGEAPWTMQKIWSGMNVPNDTALKL